MGLRAHGGQPRVGQRGHVLIRHEPSRCRGCAARIRPAEFGVGVGVSFILGFFFFFKKNQALSAEWGQIQHIISL
jgi:hypothetical protein